MYQLHNVPLPSFGSRFESPIAFRLTDFGSHDIPTRQGYFYDGEDILSKFKIFSQAFPYSSNPIIVFIRTMYASDSSCAENSGEKNKQTMVMSFLFLNIYLLYPLSYSTPAFSYIFISVSILRTFLKSNIKALYNFRFILLFPQ